VWGKRSWAPPEAGRTWGKRSGVEKRAWGKNAVRAWGKRKLESDQQERHHLQALLEGASGITKREAEHVATSTDLTNTSD